jgi:hypothetical protein
MEPPITPDEAEKSLRDIAAAGQRSRSAYGHSQASPHLMVWGVVWALGYGASYLRPDLAGPLWLGLSVAGTIASFVAGWRMRQASGRPFDWRLLASFVAVIAFAAAMFVIFRPASDAAAGAFAPLIAALYYVLTGLWLRAFRITVLGVALAVLTLGGYLWLAPWFALWMAVVGGGALILGGLWLRRV